MNSVIKEISRLRKNVPFDIDLSNTNRYRVVVNEKSGRKTAYYFSSPIYNYKSRKLTDIKFTKADDETRLKGTSADIALSKNVSIETPENSCNIDFGSDFKYIGADKAGFERGCVMPTLNGIVVKVNNSSDFFKITLKTEKPFSDVMCNGKYFALMSEKFRPFIAVSGIGLCDSDGFVVAPITISSTTISPTEFELVVFCKQVTKGGYLMFEINAYEGKLVQDTTVESQNPNCNNAFGTVAFIGHSEEFGEQWLYSRIMYNRIEDVLTEDVEKLVLHFPKHSQSSKNVKTYLVRYRFCSFGSTWNNKKEQSNFLGDSVESNGYISVDITGALDAQAFAEAIWSKGLIIQPVKKNEECVVISTGDSVYAPMILEVKYK